MSICQFCGDEKGTFDVAHVCSSGKYAPVIKPIADKPTTPSLRDAAQEMVNHFVKTGAILPVHVGKIISALAADKAQDAQPVAWMYDVVFEGKQFRDWIDANEPFGDEVSNIRPLYTHPAQPCPDCGKTTTPDTIHTCSPQVREWVVGQFARSEQYGDSHHYAIPEGLPNGEYEMVLRAKNERPMREEKK